MSIQASATRSSGGYAPTGNYSIEFIEKGDKTETSMGEYFFLMGLTSLDQTYTYRMSTEATFGGTSVVDFGVGQSPISLQGMIWPFYEGTPISRPASSALGGSFGETAGGIASAVGDGFINELQGMNPVKKSGYLDFIDLVYLMQEVRNPEKGKSRLPSVSSFYKNAFDIASTFMQTQSSFHSENVKMVFHDYDRDAHWEVTFAKDGFKIHQDAKDPMSWFWSLNFIGVKDVSEVAKIRRAMIPDPKKMLRDIRNGLNNILNALSAPLAFLAGVTELYQDIANLAEDLKADLSAFEDLNKGYLKKISKAGGPLNKKSNQFIELVNQLSFPNQVLPNFASYDAPSNPITTETPVSEKITPTIPEQFIDNIYNNGPPTMTEISLATDQTMLDMYELQMLMGQLTLALIEANNQGISNLYSYIEIKPGMTFESIANTYYGSPLNVQKLITDNGLLLIGKNIDDAQGLRIRVPSSSSYSYRNTGIIDAKFPIDGSKVDQSEQIIERWFLGEDLDLDETRDFTVANGDLGTVVGVDCLAENLIDRMLLPKGAIPAHPGLGAMPNPGGVPDDFLNLVIPRKILEDIKTDLGVETAYIKEFSLNADAFQYLLEVQPTGGLKSFKLSRKKRGLSSL
ncbi:hypothetical protein [Leptospira sp. GIMC2001]|uniref:hypothetical protein n=1 Tax=Leptospira sp. GIMC2001 TaxID=1513297 RepID=UPI00234948A2|nr:hypothetical protein [Leptospira sp. GIMC2001]WCL51429.1 hypothetical protein O4O04_20145 [Leptospira sp. GIMC2001]